MKVNSAGHPNSKSNPIKSRVIEGVFLKCGKQESLTLLFKLCLPCVI
jgi:hypothetical protein